ncbi:Suppressor of Sensor Kinase (SLN1) [Tulasnella sp. 419]|nr:Suppressor of Sensor Kinase (SLN1) [Tulasnella sp. 419]
MPHARVNELGPVARHHSTLYPHLEDGDEEEAEGHYTDGLTAPSRPASGTTHVRNRSSPSTTSSSRSRTAIRQSRLSSSTPSSSKPGRSRYATLYSQFNQKYRSRANQEGDDSNPYYFGRDLEDSDSEEEVPPRRGSTGNGITVTDADAINGNELLADSDEIPENLTPEERERLEWQTMLASVLSGEVLRAEKTRIGRALETSEAQKINRLDLWQELRARLRGRSVEHEKERLEERRRIHVGPVIEDILDFRAILPGDVAPSPQGTPNSESHVSQQSWHIPSPLKQVANLLRRWDAAESLYPHQKAMRQDNPLCATPEFIQRIECLQSWFTVVTNLKSLLNVLRQWTNSDSLDITAPVQRETVIHPARRPSTAQTDNIESTSFVERILKEDGLQRTFERGALVVRHGHIYNAKVLCMEYSDLLEDLNLPTYTEDILNVIVFPTRLMEEVLRVRLDYATKVTDPNLLTVDQMLDDFRLAIGLACTLKNEYDELMEPDPGGKWDLPPCISPEYEQTILTALKFFFKLIHMKLKSAHRGIYFKETELLEGHWEIMEEVTMATKDGGLLVAEHVCSLTNKLVLRVITSFLGQMRNPVLHEHHDDNNRASPTRTKFPAIINEPAKGSQEGEETLRWFSKVLDGVKLRQRKLLHYGRLLMERFGNSAEYDLSGIDVDVFVRTLVNTEHFLIYTEHYESRGLYLVADATMYNRPDLLRHLLVKAFHVNRNPSGEVGVGTWKVGDAASDVAASEEEEGIYAEDGHYLLILSPTDNFLWTGTVLMLTMPEIELEMDVERARLIATSPARLNSAKQKFETSLTVLQDEVEDTEPPLTLLVDRQAHLPGINKELKKIDRAHLKLAETIVDSVHEAKKNLVSIPGAQELMANWFSFASEHGQRVIKTARYPNVNRLNRLLTKLAISWVAFICDNCDPTDRKTFRGAVAALEFAMMRTTGNHILQLSDVDFTTLRQKVASCMTLLISHFDILGARSNFEAMKEKERMADMRVQQALADARVADGLDQMRPPSPDTGEYITQAQPDRSLRAHIDKVFQRAVQTDTVRDAIQQEQHIAGRVLVNEGPEDESYLLLASSSMSIRWQQGRFIGAGAFGSVYLAMNLDSGGVMAVKEIRFKDSTSLSTLYKQVQDELSVMELLHHPNIVEYYGIEVHRDKVYIFEEYCSGGTLANLLELGRIEDETVLKVYTMQMLEGLMYLHSKGVVHRDIKPDNILLDHNGIIKFVDFGAAKVFAKNKGSIQVGRTVAMQGSVPGMPGMPMHSLTGTPMYMSPEVIKSDKRGRRGAMDIWAMGCVVLECATGRKPWSNLDNEWAIMFHIGVATQHPPLPEPGQLSELGINFIKQCLTVDPMRRPTAEELYDHPWIATFRDELQAYDFEHRDDIPPTPSLTNTSFKSEAYDSNLLNKQGQLSLNQSPLVAPDISPGIVSPASDLSMESGGLYGSRGPPSKSPSPSIG